MAVLKHLTSKSFNYGAVLTYLLYDHDEKSGTVLRDANGNRILRREYWINGINCDPFLFDAECTKLNNEFHKNQTRGEIKSHHYILSFDPKDVIENELTGEKAQALGLAFAKKNFPGHQVLVCTHADGSNHSGNIHVHIVLNSLRMLDVEEPRFAERTCDTKAGYKHHVSRNFFKNLLQDVMDLCQREGLHQIDLLAPAKQKVSDREYRAAQRGQRKLDVRNSEILDAGATPRRTKFQTQKQALRNAISECINEAMSYEQFRSLLFSRYQVKVKESRGRISYLLPDREKPIRGRALGADYEKESILQRLEQNLADWPDRKDHEINQDSIEKEATADNSTDLDGSHNIELRENQAADPFAGYDLEANPILGVLFIQSDLKLVTDLQTCIKAQVSRAYKQKVQLSNLQMLAHTVAFVQENRLGTPEELDQKRKIASKQLAQAEDTLRSTKEELRQVNERIHYTGQFLATRDTFRLMLNANNKGKFRNEHAAEINLYQKARDILRSYTPEGKFPSLKSLQTRKIELLKLQKSQSVELKNIRKNERTISIAAQNVHYILEDTIERVPATHRDRLQIT
jgi:hypothetical protein